MLMSPETKNIYQNMITWYSGEFCTYSVPLKGQKLKSGTTQYIIFISFDDLKDIILFTFLIQNI